jgi:hypothetical protein
MTLQYNTTLIYVLPLNWVTKFHTHIQEQAKYFVYFNTNVIRLDRRR